MKLRRIIQWSAMALVAVAVLCGCSTKKNTAATRKYQAFITRYNIYYNGDTHYKETLSTMERGYEDDYTATTLYMHPAEAKSNTKAPQPNGNFDRSIEKAQKAIQLRTIKKRPKRKGKTTAEQKAWLKREEYNPFLHNAWMMLARSQYMNGDFTGAAATFYYISRHFSWLPATVTEAQLWQARSYVGFDWLNEAEAILTRIKEDQLTSGTLRDLYDFTWADLLVRRRDYEAAVPYLIRAAKAASGSQKSRLNFLLGQCYEAMGDKAKAYKVFAAAGAPANASYRTKLNARIKQSEVYTGADPTSEVKALRRMARMGRNAEYLDQIYYAIGNLFLSRGDTTSAIENYIIASDKSTRNGIEKAINDITLGQIYFERGEYDLAQPRFSSSVPQLPEEYPDYKTLKRRSDVLDELAVYSQNVTLQDSLLRLSAMSEDEQMAVIERIIKELKKKEKEEAEAAARAEFEANQAGQQQSLNGGANSPAQFQLNTDDSWYFYNTATLAAGRTEFQRRWGSRKLEDDWRRRNKSSFSFDDFNADDSESAEGSDGSEVAEETVTELTDEEKAAQERANDPHYPEYYLAQIPKTEEEIATANDVIQEGLYNMGSILKDKLEDFSAAHTQWGKLLTRYPDNVYRLDVYYGLYIMYIRMNRPDLAEPWRQLILSEFADSKYGVAMQDPHYIDNLRRMPAEQERRYAEAYEAYLNNDNGAVHRAYESMNVDYPLSTTLPKFMILHALAYVTENQPEQFNATLRELLERYPDTDLTNVASSWLKGMAQGRDLHSGDSNMRGMIWDIRLGGDGGEGDAPTDLAEFDFDPNKPQMLVLVYATDEVNPNELLYQVARHNFSSFVTRDFDLEVMNFGRLGMLLIKGFNNEAEVNHYRSVMQNAASGFVLPQEVTPVTITEDNFSTLITQGRTLEEYFRAAANASIEKTEEFLEVPEDVELPEELPADLPEELPAEE